MMYDELIHDMYIHQYIILGDSLEQSYGVDMKLILEYVRKYNFTPLLIVDPNKDWGLPYGNQTKTGGTVGQVVDGYADIAVGMSAVRIPEY